MNSITVRRRRLEQLLDLAQAYKGCSRKELAKTLGRDPTKLVPTTGVPKLDLVVELATVLDWPVGEVAAFLWHAPNGQAAPTEGDFDAINAAAGQAHREGQYPVMLELARRALAAAATPEQRARACNREAGAWDGLGRYMEVLQATRRGLQETAVPASLRRMLQSNLANAYYCLWSLVESGSIARELIAHFRAEPPDSAADRKTEAFALYVSGNTHRRQITLEPDQARQLAARARPDLDRARELYERLAVELADPALEGIANTCRGGLLEADVELGARPAAAALDELCAGLDQIRDTSTDLVGDRLESYGWWCIFGCNLALRHIADDRALQQYMAVFTNKADEIADRLDNWSMRERVYTMQYARWERATTVAGFDFPCVIDTDDVRVIAGTMGRFPTFRDTGWQLLRSARIIDDN